MIMPYAAAWLSKWFVSIVQPEVEEAKPEAEKAEAEVFETMHE